MFRTSKVLPALLTALLCLGCSGSGHFFHSDVVEPGVAVALGGTGWPTTLPVDALQAGEELSPAGFAVTARGARLINDETQFNPGVLRFGGGGMVADNGQATALAGFAGAVSYALYRLPLGGAEPGVVTVDANTVSPAGYFVGLADYSGGRWEWHGPFLDSHVRLVCAGPDATGADYTSGLGSTFICVVAAAESLVDVVGVGVNALDATDTTPPAAPAAPQLEPSDGALRVRWEAVADEDIAGYRVYWSSSWFFDGAGTGVHHTDSLVDRSEYLITGITLSTFVRVGAVDTSGNCSALGEFALATPDHGSPLTVSLAASAPSVVTGQALELTAAGAASYDFDLDSDGEFEITNTTGSVSLGTIEPRLCRVTVWGSTPTGDRQGCASASVLVVSGDPGNAVPVGNLQVSSLLSDEGVELAFDATASYDTDGDVVRFEYDFNGDKFYELSSGEAAVVLHTYDGPGLYAATVRVTDEDGARDTATKFVRINEVFGTDTPWPHRGGNPRRNGRSVNDGPQTNGVKWAFPAGSLVRSSPAVAADGTVYFGCDDDYLYAVRANGSLKWKYETGGNVSSSPAIGADGTVYVGSWDRKLHAVAPDGEASWSFPTGDIIESSPVIGPDGTIYCGSNDNHLYALTPDGSEQWAFAAGDWITSSPSLAPDGTVYFGCQDYQLYALTPDGELKWTFTTDSPVDSSPAVGVDGTVYVGSWDRYLYAVSPQGALVWSYRTGANVDSTPALARDGTVYICSRNHKLYALKPDGSFKWQFVTGDGISSSPAVDSDGTIYVGSADDFIYAINPDGSLKWSYHTGGDVDSSPALSADGTLYVGSLDFKLYAFGP